jgi:peptidoglycan/xylan/chitin deacetylase (PgdA/CDA1 family)
MVHGVHDAAMAAAAPPPSSSVSLGIFEATVQSLMRCFCFVSMDEAVTMLSGQRPFRSRCLVLTFDDSLKSHVELVAPRLHRWGVPATFYLSTEAIESRQPYWWLRLEYAVSRLKGRTVTIEVPGNKRFVLGGAGTADAVRQLKAILRAAPPSEPERVVAAVEAKLGLTAADTEAAYPHARLLTWDDARRLRDLGMTIGSHTVSHPNLTAIEPDALIQELSGSREALEAKLGVACRHFCYPYGAYSDRVQAAASAAGYASAVTASGPGWNEPAGRLVQLNRFSLGRDSRLSYELSGLGLWVRALRRVQTRDSPCGSAKN